MIQVNLKAIFFLSQAAARVMIEQGGGKIIHIASMLSYHGGILVPSYTAAKSGLAGLTFRPAAVQSPAMQMLSLPQVLCP